MNILHVSLRHISILIPNKPSFIITLEHIFTTCVKSPNSTLNCTSPQFLNENEACKKEYHPDEGEKDDFASLEAEKNMLESNILETTNLILPLICDWIGTQEEPDPAQNSAPLGTKSLHVEETDNISCTEEKYISKLAAFVRIKEALMSQEGEFKKIVSDLRSISDQKEQTASNIAESFETFKQ